jgi:hypothetical protein
MAAKIAAGHSGLSVKEARVSIKCTKRLLIKGFSRDMMRNTKVLQDSPSEPTN